MKHPSGSSNKSVTSQKGGVISDVFAKQTEVWANVNWFLAKQGKRYIGGRGQIQCIIIL